jgi:hypothetical protein
MSRTPGSWSLSDFFPGEVYAADGDVVAAAHPSREDSERMANAHLISAAPDLLAACEAALRGWGRVHEADCSIGPDGNRCSCHVGMLETAVKKAKGEKP